MAKDSLARATTATQRRYDRLAPSYDRMMDFMERRVMSRWRRLLWSRVPIGRGLEVGVGTGANMPYYPRGASVAAVDISPRMLQHACEQSRGLGLSVDLGLMMAEALAFPDRTFDWVVSTFVFCSVPDPVAGLRELGRVCRSEGTILLLEHVRIDRPVIGPLMDLLSPLTVRIGGEHINRRTVENVHRAGLRVVRVEELGPMGLVKLITARPSSR